MTKQKKRNGDILKFFNKKKPRKEPDLNEILILPAPCESPPKTKTKFAKEPEKQNVLHKERITIF